MKSKVISMQEAVSHVKDNDTILVSGFGPKNYPGRLMKALWEDSTAKDLLFAFNAPEPTYMPVAEKLLLSRSRGLIATYVRGSKGAEKLYKEGKLELSPQGTFAERLRAGGMGIPAFYTPVGLGTMVEEGKEKKTIDGREYLMEKAIHGNVAFIRAQKVDLCGNCYLNACEKNFGAMMPAAADYAVVEAEELVEVGTIDPEMVTIPGILLDAIVKVGG